MSDETKPAIARMRVAITMTSGTGTRLEYAMASHGPGGTKAAQIVDPNKVLFDAVKELARIGAIAGLQEEVSKAVQEAFAAVAKWEAQQK